MKWFKTQKIKDMTDAELDKTINFQSKISTLILVLTVALLGMIGVKSYISQQLTMIDAVAIPIVFMANLVMVMNLMNYGFEKRFRSIKT